MRAEYAADLVRRYQTFVKVPQGYSLQKIAAGANVDDYHWTEVFMRETGKLANGLSIHYYTSPGPNWNTKRSSTDFGEDQWIETLSKALFMDELVTKHSAVMDKYDPDKKVGLMVDEWGTWYTGLPGVDPGFLHQQNSLRDALVAAIHLNIFSAHSDRVKMAAIAQMVNVLQAMILTNGEKMVLTPTYHVFEMYKPFKDATYLPLELSRPDLRVRGVQSARPTRLRCARERREDLRGRRQSRPQERRGSEPEDPRSDAAHRVGSDPDRGCHECDQHVREAGCRHTEAIQRRETEVGPADREPALQVGRHDDVAARPVTTALSTPPGNESACFDAERVDERRTQGRQLDFSN